MLRFLRQVLRGFFLAALCVITIPATAFAVVIGSLIFLPLPANLPQPNQTGPSQATKIFDIDGKEIAEVRSFDQNIPVQRSDIPLVLKQALISSEDKNFYKHHGVDLRGSLRALWADVRNKQVVQGGSTITQQYVKLAYTNEDRTLTRKVREAILASRLDRQTDKDEILYRYLSIVYFGDGAYGIGAASESYFHKPVAQLTASEASILVGLIPAPSRWAPRENPTEAEVRRKVVLDKMLQQRYLTQQQHDDAIKQTVWLESSGNPPGLATVVYSESQVTTQYPYFVDYVKKYIRNKYGEDMLFKGGLQVQTTLTPALQQEAEQSVSQSLGGTKPPLEMAMVAVEPPTGYVRALVGGRDFASSQVNLALGGCPAHPAAGSNVIVRVEPSCWKDPVPTGGGTGRQPGSSFKSFVLATAYEKGISPNKIYPAPPVYFAPTCKVEKCAVHNNEGESTGPISIKEAIAQSINTVYAPLTLDVGTANVANMARRLGLSSAIFTNQDGDSGNYGLGTIDTSPLEMASAYGVFADRGMRQPATPIVKIVDASGRVIEDNTGRAPARVLDEAVADNVTDALRGVITHGTGFPTADIGRPAAGKTGTTSDFHDAWFVGYTPTLSTAVWMGNSSGATTMNYRGQTRIFGATVSAPTWATFMKMALKDVPVTDFSQPAPIKAPAQNVLPVAGPTTEPAIAPQDERSPATTPAGNFDRTNTGRPSVAAPPTTEVPTAIPAPAAFSSP